ncbi:hypothetical protein L1887_16227 [Cichorium endivia]|nr:hypothetical protein L1887_16227 [Cichorium endivia]
MSKHRDIQKFSFLTFKFLPSFSLITWAPSFSFLSIRRRNCQKKKTPISSNTSKIKTSSLHPHLFLYC